MLSCLGGGQGKRLANSMQVTLESYEEARGKNCRRLTVIQQKDTEAEANVQRHAESGTCCRGLVEKAPRVSRPALELGPGKARYVCLP
jgi:hypothetical protein